MSYGGVCKIDGQNEMYIYLDFTWINHRAVGW